MSPNYPIIANSIVDDILILTGEQVGPSDVTWQDVAKTLSVNLEVLAGRLYTGDSKSVDCLHTLVDELRNALAE